MDAATHFCRSRDGARIAWSRGGSGPTLLRIGTWPSHLELDRGSPITGPLLEALEQRFHLIRFDLRDTGLSERGVANVSFQTWVEDIEAVVAAAAPPRFRIYGHSQGAALAVAYTTRHAGRIEQLLLGGAYVRGRLARARLPADRHQVEAFRSLIRAGWDNPTPVFRHVFSELFFPQASDAQRAAWDHLQIQSASADAALRTTDVVDRIDVGELLPRVQVPARVLHSQDDKRVPLDEALRFAAGLPRSSFVMLPGANHIWLETDPSWPIWLEQLDAFAAATAGDAQSRVQMDERLRNLDTLTEREREVLEGIAAGRSNREICEALGVSPATLRNHISHVFAKIGVTQRAQAIVRARNAGFGRG
jgi:pimeloyl-ACP methyl ester carboxylesterase/DNA-binding CsgD family transcriptional regulator